MNISPLAVTATLVTMLNGPAACRTGDSPTLKPVSAGCAGSPSVISNSPPVVNLRTVWSKLSAQYTWSCWSMKIPCALEKMPSPQASRKRPSLSNTIIGWAPAVEDVDPVLGIHGDARDLDEGPALGQLLPALQDLILQPVRTDRHDMLLS